MPANPRVARDPGPNPNLITEPRRPGCFMISFYHQEHCHENIVVDGGAAGVPNNSVLADADGDLIGIIYEGVPKGVETLRAALVRGPAEVSVRYLVFPKVTNAADGPDAGTDNTAENAAATAALKASLIADLTAAGIVVRD